MLERRGENGREEIVCNGREKEETGRALPREKHVGIHAGTSEVIRNRQLASLPAGILPFHYH